MAVKKNESSTSLEAKKSIDAPIKDCPQCKPGPEYYRMLFDQYKFDVDLAREIVSDGREVMELEKEDVEHALKWAHIYRPHLDHVDTRYPGIIAHYWYKDQNGEILHGHVLIDGHHRAAKVFEANQNFYVQVLSEEESKRVTMRSPMMDPEKSDCNSSTQGVG